jgi:hypothetical protein
VKSLRDARQEYWRRFRMISRRHRPLPHVGAGWFMLHDDVLLGLDLDDVLEGPERQPADPVRSRDGVSLPALTGIDRTMARVRFYAEEGLTDPEVMKIRRRLP